MRLTETKLACHQPERVQETEEEEEGEKEEEEEEEGEKEEEEEEDLATFYAERRLFK